jgi:hypothetical protein
MYICVYELDISHTTATYKRCSPQDQTSKPAHALMPAPQQPKSVAQPSIAVAQASPGSVAQASMPVAPAAVQAGAEAVVSQAGLCMYTST